MIKIVVYKNATDYRRAPPGPNHASINWLVVTMCSVHQREQTANAIQLHRHILNCSASLCVSIVMLLRRSAKVKDQVSIQDVDHSFAARRKIAKVEPIITNKPGFLLGYF